MGAGPTVATTSPRHDIAPLSQHGAPRDETMASRAEEADAPSSAVQETIRMVGRKWHLILLWELSQRPAGFNELKHRAGGISAKMLSQSLNDLEQSGLVVRDIVTERPLRVMYHLTAKAEELTAIFDVLDAWGRRHGITAADTLGSN
jgi:DNA-binding HxlR family transcriptional regulator